MQLYQFEKIYSQMEREFGKIKKGEEDIYDMIFLPLEGNALKVHRANPKSNSRRLREAVALTLFDIKIRYSGENIDIEKFRNEDNEKLEKALLMAFDPFSNEEVLKVLEMQNNGNQLSQEQLYQYYKIPIMCLLRIKDSIDMWEKNAGADGYFEFIERCLGGKIQGDEMKYSIMVSDL